MYVTLEVSYKKELLLLLFVKKHCLNSEEYLACNQDCILIHVVSVSFVRQQETGCRGDNGVVLTH